MEDPLKTGLTWREAATAGSDSGVPGVSRSSRIASLSSVYTKSEIRTRVPPLYGCAPASPFRPSTVRAREPFRLPLSPAGGCC